MSMRVGWGGRGQLLRLQAVGEGMQMFDQETHHQHVLLCRSEGLLKRQAVTKCSTNIKRYSLKQPILTQPTPEAAKQITRGSERWEYRGPTLLLTVANIRISLDFDKLHWEWKRGTSTLCCCLQQSCFVKTMQCFLLWVMPANTSVTFVMWRGCRHEDNEIRSWLACKILTNVVVSFAFFRKNRKTFVNHKCKSNNVQQTQCKKHAIKNTQQTRTTPQVKFNLPKDSN